MATKNSEVSNDPSRERCKTCDLHRSQRVYRRHGVAEGSVLIHRDAPEAATGIPLSSVVERVTSILCCCYDEVSRSSRLEGKILYFGFFVAFRNTTSQLADYELVNISFPSTSHHERNGN